MQEMTAEREGAILEAAVETYGEYAQIDMMIEEMSELAKALLKYRRGHWIPHKPGSGRDKREEMLSKLKCNILEEMADVQIMLNQLQLIYGDCTDWEIQKLERLAERLGMEEARDDG